MARLRLPAGSFHPDLSPLLLTAAVVAIPSCAPLVTSSPRYLAESSLSDHPLQPLWGAVVSVQSLLANLSPQSRDVAEGPTPIRDRRPYINPPWGLQYDLHGGALIHWPRAWPAHCGPQVS